MEHFGHNTSISHLHLAYRCYRFFFFLCMEQGNSFCDRQLELCSQIHIWFKHFTKPIGFFSCIQRKISSGPQKCHERIWMLSIRGKGEWDWNGNTVILKPDNDVRGFAHKHVVACSWLMDRKIKKMMVLFKQNKTALFRESKVTQGSNFVLIGAKWSTRALWIVQYSNALGFSWVYSVQHSACLKI